MGFMGTEIWCVAACQSRSWPQTRFTLHNVDYRRLNLRRNAQIVTIDQASQIIARLIFE